MALVPRRQSARKSISKNRHLNHPLRASAGFVCKDCGLIFNILNDFLEHYVIFHDPKTANPRYYCCEQCGRLFTNMSDLDEHAVDHDVAVVASLVEKSKSVKEAKPKDDETAGKHGAQEHPGKSSTNEGHYLRKRKREDGRSETKTVSPIKIVKMGAPTKKGKTSLAVKPSSRRMSSASETAVTNCPTCEREFLNTWDMVDHAVSEHQACIVKLDRKLYRHRDGAAALSEPFCGTKACPYCAEDFAATSDCLLHAVRRHRNAFGLYAMPDWADALTVAAELQCANAGRFKVNVTVKRAPFA